MLWTFYYIILIVSILINFENFYTPSKTGFHYFYT